MTSRIISAGIYYHNMYPGSIIFYRMENSYVAFQEDAERAAKILQTVVDPALDGVSRLSIVQPKFCDAMELLTACGVQCRCVIYRDDNGKLAIPDVKRLKKEKKFDY